MCIFCSYGSYVSKGKEFSELYVTMTGLLMIAAQCTVSGMASVYAEYILKKQQEVTYFLYMYMYIDHVNSLFNVCSSTGYMFFWLKTLNIM